MNRIESIQHDCTELLNQLKYAIQLIPDENYSKPSPVLSGSTLGMHIRHVLEFFLTFQNGLASGKIDYDSRERDIRIETNKSFALQTIDKVCTDLSQNLEDQIIQVLYQGNEAMPMASSLARELTYNLEHCVHHMAILNIGIASEISPQILPETFGVAASTLKYRESVNVHGQLSA